MPHEGLSLSRGCSIFSFLSGNLAPRSFPCCLWRDSSTARIRTGTEVRVWLFAGDCVRRVRKQYLVFGFTVDNTGDGISKQNWKSVRIKNPNLFLSAFLRLRKVRRVDDFTPWGGNTGGGVFKGELVLLVDQLILVVDLRWFGLLYLYSMWRGSGAFLKNRFSGLSVMLRAFHLIQKVHLLSQVASTSSLVPLRP